MAFGQAVPGIGRGGIQRGVEGEDLQCGSITQIVADRIAGCVDDSLQLIGRNATALAQP
ncbi:hypothetical protein D3C81_2334030 [compost metagenome]